MAQAYAKSQPSGFQNHIKNIAVVGAGGNIGSYIVAALLANGHHNITALTRPESTSVFPAGVTAKHIDYSSQPSLVSALQGQDALIITMAATAPPDQQTSLIRAAAEAGVRWVMPNEWGQDCSHPGLRQDLAMLSTRFEAARQLIEELGVSHWLVVPSGFWYEYSLAGSEWRYGFDFAERRVTFYGDGTQKINTSTWPQIGRAVAALLAFKILPDDEDDKSEAVLSKFQNQRCYMSSFRVSQKDMFESVLRVTGTKESDWNVSYEDVHERFQKGLERVQKGDMNGFAQLLYARTFFPDGAGDHETIKGLHNELLGLPQEDFDECTKGAVEMAKTLAGTY
ncbi:hypothetical protein BP6252_01327 [Coleophoma cylindrospora]|uniref:NmrA-like domain-containing protein n=1 Tax=Coleophoma cylindrospora TaxID=1849047 RepID=A0A3D8SSN2_9HELO|nr:hypothetical protein BP6252_01327 [Coleophoma cylindrospora]